MNLQNEQLKATAEVVNSIFLELQGLFPAFRQAWPTPSDFTNAKLVWTKAFIESNLTTMESIRYGLKKCRTQCYSFVPNVAQFISWCIPSPEDLNLPKLDLAYSEAIRNAYLYNRNPTWSHPAVLYAANCMRRDELNRQDEEAKKKFDRHYKEACKLIFEGKILEDLPKSLEHKKEKPASNTAAELALNNLYNIVGLTR